jgi:hypothetical protein
LTGLSDNREQALVTIDAERSMTKQSPGSGIAQKALGAMIIWGTVGLICVQVLFTVTFGPAA